MAKRLRVAPVGVLDTRQVIVDEIGDPDLTPPDALREEAPFRDLGLPLAVGLEREPLRADALAVLAPVLVVVTNPPDA